MGILEEHRQGAVARGCLELKIGRSFCRGVGAESVSHVMRPAIRNTAAFKGLLPGLLDVDAAEGGLAREDEWFVHIAEVAKAPQLGYDGIAERDAARTPVLALLDVGDLVLEVDMFPFQVEDFALARAGREGQDDVAIEVGGFARARGGKEASDLVFREYAVAAWILFEFDEPKRGILANPAKMLGRVGEKRGEGGA